MDHATRRRGARLLAAFLLLTPLAGAALSANATAQTPPTTDPQLWPIDWDLNRTHDVEELSRVFDRNEDGVIDARVMPEGDLEVLLNPTAFSLYADACAAPSGAISFDWELSRIDGGEIVATQSTQGCEVELPLPERPFPDAKKYDLEATAHFANTHDQVVTERVTVRDVFMVGLGDSYGSGEGNPLDAWHFGDPHAEWDNNRCHRSRLSGQEQAARMLDTIQGINVTFLHVACSGALAAEGILAPYAGLIVDEGVAPLPTQIEQVAEFTAYSAVDPAQRRYPDLVVTSIGGNDAGFADVVTECLYPSWIPIPIPVFPYFAPLDIDECHEAGAARTEIFEPGVAALPDLYRDMNDAIKGNYGDLPELCHPERGCQFMITEYPDGATDENGNTCEYMGFVEDEFQWVIDDMVPTLNNTILEMTQELGWVYVDGVRSNFDRHGICAADDFFRDIAESFEIQKDKNGSFHPDTKGHYFGYAPAIVESARDALGFPYPWAYTPFPAYAGRDVPQVCDTVVRDGKQESFVPAPPADISSLNLPSEIATRLTSGSLPSGMAGASTCDAATGVNVPSGQPVMELRTGRPGCPNDPRPCADSSAASTLLRFPTFGDQQPAIVARAESEVARQANDEGSFAHRSGSANAQGTTVFLAAPFDGSSVVSGELVVALSAVAQAAGADASALSTFDMWIRTVGPKPDCSGTECDPNTVRDIGRLRVSLQRTTCEEDATFPNNCQAVYGHQRIHTDQTTVSATTESATGTTTIVDIDEYDVSQTATAMGSWVSVGGGLRTPTRTVRIPYSVPAGTVVSIQVSAGAYSTVLEDCVSPINPLRCSAQTRMGATVTFAPDVTTGALIPLSGWSPIAPDRTAPTVTATPSGPAGNNGWYTGPVNVALDATDDGAGVESISYKVNGGTTVVVPGSTANVSLPTNGTHLVQYTAVDVAGNKSEAQSVTVKIDAAKPTVTVDVASGAQYAAGAIVATGLRCSDLLSQLASCTGPATLDTTRLGSHTATFVGVDLAGNTNSVAVPYTVVAAAPPDRITLSVKELRFKVDGPVISGGFTVTRAADGKPTAIVGTAVVLSPANTQTTISINATRSAKGEWTGITVVDDPDMDVDVTAEIDGKNDVKADGATAVKGKATAKKPKYTVDWTLIDLG